MEYRYLMVVVGDEADTKCRLQGQQGVLRRRSEELVLEYPVEMQTTGALEVLLDVDGNRLGERRSGYRLLLEARGILRLHPTPEPNRVEDERHLVWRLQLGDADRPSCVGHRAARQTS